MAKGKRTGQRKPHSGGGYPKNLERIPTTSKFNGHEWADYLELLCLANLDGILTKADAFDRIRPSVKDLREGGEAISKYEPEEDESYDEEQIDGVADTNVDSVSTGSSEGQRTDEWNKHLVDLFNHLAFRRQIFGDFYPFEIDGNGSLVKKETTDLQQKFYVSLLLSANLAYVGRKHHPLTQSFEVLSLEVMKRCLPVGAEAHLFGTSPLLPRRYNGNLWKRINSLAADINEKVTAPETDFSNKSVGDGGLDLVGWMPCGDKLNSIITIFGQSACTDNWVSKQATSSAEAWRRRMTFAASPFNMIFIPFCLRNPDGSWHSGSTIQSIMVDRLRFIYFLKDRLELFQKLPSYQMVEKILALKEEIV